MISPGPPRVSVLIPVFNGDGSIQRAIRSCLSQTLSDIEVIVIDDASTDRTAEVVGSLARDDPRIRLVGLGQNAGPGAARTAGLREATGDWVAILDADDQIETTRFSTLIQIAEEDDLDAIADNLALLDPGLGQTVGTAFPLAPGDAVHLTPERFLENARPGGKVNLGWMQPLVRRDFLIRHAIVWPAIRHAEDLVFIMRLLLNGARFTLVGDPLYIYTQRRGAESGIRSATSRTVRSDREQHRALALIAEDPRAGILSPRARRRLDAMRSEITATTSALDLRDALEERDLAGVPRRLAGLALRAPALARCLHARYVTGWRLR